MAEMSAPDLLDGLREQVAAALAGHPRCDWLADEEGVVWSCGVRDEATARLHHQANAALAVVRPVVDALTANHERTKQSLRRKQLRVDALTAEHDRLDAALDEEIANRDRAVEWADRLAYAIAPQNVIGEHSSDNNPWQNALDHVGAEVAAVTIDSDRTEKAASDEQDHWATGLAEAEAEVAALRAKVAVLEAQAESEAAERAWAEADAIRLTAERDQWRDRMWVSVQERAVWRHQEGEHEGGRFAYCPMCERDEARQVRDQVSAAYRDAIGVPESEHQRERMERLATELESALAEVAALRETVDRVHKLADEWAVAAQEHRAAAHLDGDIERDWIASGIEGHLSELRAALGVTE